MILLIGALMAFSFVVGVAAGTWRLRRYWQQLQAKEKFLDTRDKQKPPADPAGVEQHTGIFGIEGTVVVVSHDVIVDHGNIMVPRHGGSGAEMYAFQGPMRRRHQLLLEEIITAPATMETAPVEPESQREPDVMDDWDPDDSYEETDGDDD